LSKLKRKLKEDNETIEGVAEAGKIIRGKLVFVISVLEHDEKRLLNKGVTTGHPMVFMHLRHVVNFVKQHDSIC